MSNSTLNARRSDARKLIDRLRDDYLRDWHPNRVLELSGMIQEVPPDNHATAVTELLSADLERRYQRDGRLSATLYQECLPEYSEIATRLIAEFDPHVCSDSVSRNTGYPVAGEILGDFHLLEQIGSGGMGIVFKAQQISLDRIVAIKILAPGRVFEDDVVRRFLAEAQIVAQLAHSGIVPIYEVRETAGFHYFAMEYVPGRNLAERIQTGYLEPRDAAELTIQIAAAIQDAHERNVIHRDLKPANVLLDVGGQPRVTDFGLARRINIESSLTSQDVLLGSPNYMTPEYVSGQDTSVSVGTDVYGIGAILYAALTGRPPHIGTDTYDTLKKVEHEDPIVPARLNPAVSTDLQTICLKCLSKQPKLRYATAADVVADLQRYLDGDPILARPDSVVRRIRRYCVRNPFLIATVLLLTLGLVGTSTGWLEASRERKLSDLRLRESLVSKAESILSTNAQGQRVDALAALQEAAAIQPSANVNDLAIQALARIDLLPEVVLPAADADVCTVDRTLTRFACATPEGTIVIGQTSDFTVGRTAKTAVRKQLSIPDIGLRAYGLQLDSSGRFLAAVYRKAADGVADEFRVWDTDTMQTLNTVPAHIHGEAWDFDPNRDEIAVCDNAGIIHIVDLSTDSVLRKFPRVGWTARLKYRPDSELIALSRCEPPEVQLLNSTTGHTVATLPHDVGVQSIAFSTDGRLLAAAVAHDIQIWDVDERRVLNRLTGHDSAVSGLSFSPRAGMLASSSWDGTVRLWHPLAERILLETRGRHWISFGRDGRGLAGIEVDDGMALCAVVGHEYFDEVYAHSGGPGPISLSISGDGQWFASGGVDGVKIRRIDDPHAEPRVLTAHTVGECRFSAATNTIAAAGVNELFLWPGHPRAGDSTTGRFPPFCEPFTYPLSRSDMNPLRAVAVSADGRRLAVADSDSSGVLVLTVPDFTNPVSLATRGGLGAICMSPCGEIVVTGTFGQGRSTTVWNAATGARIAELPVGDAHLMMSPDGKWLVTGGINAYRVWDTGTWKPVQTIIRNLATLRGPAAVSADRSVLAVVLTPRRVTLLRTSDWRPVASLSAPAGDVISEIQMTPDSEHLLVACESHTVQVWNLQQLEERLNASGFPCRLL